MFLHNDEHTGYWKETLGELNFQTSSFDTYMFLILLKVSGTSEVRFHRKFRFSSFLNSVKFFSSVSPFEVRLICQCWIKFCELQSLLCCRGYPGEARYWKKKWEYYLTILTNLVPNIAYEVLMCEYSSFWCAWDIQYLHFYYITEFEFILLLSLRSPTTCY